MNSTSILRKQIRTTFMKTVFSCNNNLYYEAEGVSRGSSLGPVLANPIAWNSLVSEQRMIVSFFDSIYFTTHRTKTKHEMKKKVTVEMKP